MTALPFILVILGLLLVVIEFYVPGIVMGVTGAILIVASIFIFALQEHSFLEIVAFIVAAVVSVAFLIAYTLRRIPKAKPGRSIYLGTDQEGYQSSSFDTSLIGLEGKALSDLKPSGHVFVKGGPHQAISQGNYIEKGSHIIVIGGRGAYLIVKLKE